MRPYAAAVALALVTACAGGAHPAARPATPTVSETPYHRQALDAAAVARAVASARAAGTAHYDMRFAIRFGPGVLTYRETGAYDLPAHLSSNVVTFEASSPEAAKEMGLGPPLGPVRLIRTPQAGYQQMEAWRGAAHGRWLRFSAREFQKVAPGTDLLAVPFPPFLAALSQGTTSTRQDSTPETAFVDVPARAAFDGAFGFVKQSLVAKHLDATRLTGSVTFEVHVDPKGRITQVRADLDPLFDQAFRLLGDETAARLADAAEAVLTLDGIGAPAGITVPSGHAVMTDAELRRAYSR